MKPKNNERFTTKCACLIVGRDIVGVNLQILGRTAIPRLASQFKVKVEFTEARVLAGMPQKEFQSFLKKQGEF
jgi:hypothetical protein